MANSRLEKIGTILSRVEGLLKGRAMNWEDRPLWYDVYKAFPPKDEPCYARSTPHIELNQIFYEEDKIRAKLHQRFKNIGAINLLNHKSKTFTQNFLDVWNSLEDKKLDDEDRFNCALDLVRSSFRSVKIEEVAKPPPDQPKMEPLDLKQLLKEDS